MNEVQFISALVTKCNIDLSDIEDIFRFFKISKNYFDIVSLYFKLKRDYQDISQYNVNIISLGTKCLSRTIPTRLGFIKTQAEGRKQLPFDLAVHPIESVFKLLKDDFQGYKADNIIYNKLYEEYPFFSSTKLNILFNHDFSNNIKNYSIDDFNQQLKVRSDNFLKIAKEGRNLFLVSDNQCFNLLYIDKINDLITKYNKSNKLVFINTGKKLLYSSKYEILNIPFPVIDKKGYIWFNPNHYLTLQGYNFEKTIGDFLYTYIIKNFQKQIEVKNYSHKNSLDYNYIASNRLLAIKENILALEYAYKCIENCIDDKKFKYYILISSIYLELNKLDHAIKYAYKAIDSSTFDSYKNLIILLRRSKKFEEAIDVLNQTIKNIIKNDFIIGWSYFQLSLILAEKKQISQAIDYAQISLKYDSVKIGYKNNLILLLIKDKKYDDAINMIKNILQVTEYHWGYMQLARIYSIQRKRAEAIACAQKAIELNPNEEKYKIFLKNI